MRSLRYSDLKMSVSLEVSKWTSPVDVRITRKENGLSSIWNVMSQASSVDWLGGRGTTDSGT